MGVAEKTVENTKQFVAPSCTVSVHWQLGFVQLGGWCYRNAKKYCYWLSGLQISKNTVHDHLACADRTFCFVSISVRFQEFMRCFTLTICVPGTCFQHSSSSFTWSKKTRGGEGPCLEGWSTIRGWSTIESWSTIMCTEGPAGAAEQQDISLVWPSWDMPKSPWPRGSWASGGDRVHPLLTFRWPVHHQSPD